MVADREQKGSQPGILYFDPSPTSAQMICASLRLAGYRVLHAQVRERALALAKQHGPQGDHALVALVLDNTVNPNESSELVQALAKLPGINDLPTLMIVHPGDPHVSELSRIPRPVRASLLLQALRDSIESLEGAHALDQLEAHSPKSRLKAMLTRHLPETRVKESLVQELFRALQDTQEFSGLDDWPNLSGSLQFMSAGAVLEHLSKVSARGCLSVQGPGERLAEIYLDRGRVYSARLSQSDTGPSYRLGEAVVARGLANAKEIEHVAQTCPDAFRIGQALVAETVINDEQCRDLLQEQTRLVTTHVVTWEHGRFSFVCPDKEPEPVLQARIDGVSAWSVAPLILEGLRHRDIQAMQVGSSISLEDCFIRDEPAILKLGTQCLDREELALLELLNGRNSVREATRRLNVGTFQVLRVLDRLRQAGLVEQNGAPLASG